MFLWKWVKENPVASVVAVTVLYALFHFGNIYPEKNDAREGGQGAGNETTHAEASLGKHMDQGGALATAQSAQPVVNAPLAHGVQSVAPVEPVHSTKSATASAVVPAGHMEQPEAVQEVVVEEVVVTVEPEPAVAEGKKSIFDFFRAHPKESVKHEVVTTEGEGKKSLFDFFRRDKDSSESAKAEESAEADTAAGVKEEVPFLQVEKTEVVVAAPTASSKVQVTSPTQAPVVQFSIPEVEAPKVEAPKVEAPKVEAPKAPVPKQPIHAAPVMPVVPEAPAKMPEAHAPAAVKQVPSAPTRPVAPVQPGVSAPPGISDQRMSSLAQARQAFWRHDNEAAFAIYKNLVNSDPSNPVLLGEFGNLLVQMQRYGEAMNVYEKAANTFIDQGRFGDAHPLIGFIGSFDKQRALALVQKIRNK
ncbi:MAG: hypothetical protein ACWA5X_01110 [bacterium]